MKVVRASEDRLEASEQQRHRQNVLTVMGEDWIKDVGITVAQPGEVSARNQTSRQVVGAMQVEYCLLDGLQCAVRQSRLENAASHRQEVEVRWCPPLGAAHHEAGLQQRPVETTAVVADEHAGLADALSDRPEERILLVEVAEKVLGERQTVRLAPGEPDEEGDGAGATG